MFMVTGASGKLGGLVVEALLRLVPADKIGVSVRDPRKLSGLAKRGVRVRRGDYDDADSLRHAWEGATRLLLVSSNAAAHGGDPLEHMPLILNRGGIHKLGQISESLAVQRGKNDAEGFV